MPIDSLLFERSDQAAIAITGISAYTNGFEFAVTRLIHPEAPGWDGGHVPIAPRGWRVGYAVAAGSWPGSRRAST